MLHRHLTYLDDEGIEADILDGVNALLASRNEVPLPRDMSVSWFASRGEVTYLVECSAALPGWPGKDRTVKLVGANIVVWAPARAKVAKNQVHIGTASRSRCAGLLFLQV